MMSERSESVFSEVIRTGLIAGLVFFAGFWAGGARDQYTITPDGTSDDLFVEHVDVQKLRDVWNIVYEKYPGDIDEKRLSEGVFRGLVSGLSDPYSSYATKTETEQLEEDLTGSLTGVGIEITKRRGIVIVVAPLRNSPAEEAGLRAQDIIIAIDGEDIDPDASLSEVASRIRGPIGTKVTLRIVREDSDEPIDITIQRSKIEIVSVDWRIENSIGILEVSSFHNDTSKKVRAAIREFLSHGVSGIVLDMNNNPGGVLDAAIAVAGHFIPEGEVILKEVPKDPQNTITHISEGPADAADIPVVVLVNGGTASGAEIVAGALRDTRGITLVGKRTFGKGAVQELVPLKDGSSIRVTIAKWITPSGIEISENGLEPDIESDEDAMEKSIRVLLDTK